MLKSGSQAQQFLSDWSRRVVAKVTGNKVPKRDLS
jgi:hypothetical protein